MILTDKVGKQLIYEIRDVNIYEREVGSDKFFKSNLILYDPKLQKEYHYIIDPE